MHEAAAVDGGRAAGEAVKVTVVVLLACLAVVLAFVGNYHFVRMDDGDTKICEKETWSLSSTHVDLADFVGRSRFELADRVPVLRALERCHLITIGNR